MSNAAQPLPTRPRRTAVRRPPSPRAAQRALRRTAPRTTARVWRRSDLPGPAVATAGAPPAEVASVGLALLLLFVPVLVWTQASAGAFVALAVALAVGAYFAWARRVVVGEDFVAVRRAAQYHVAHVDHVRHLELRAMQGGALCVHTDDGRCMRLRRVELERPGVADALRSLAERSGGTFDQRVSARLDLAADDGRLVERYAPAS